MIRKMLCVKESTHRHFKKLAEKQKRKVYDMVEIVLDYFLKQKDKENKED